IGHGVAADVHPAVDDAVVDPERGGQAVHARGGGAQGAVGGFRGHHVEGGHRLREMHRVVEPEALIVRGGELHVVRIGGLRGLGTGHHLQRARRREGARRGVRVDAGSPHPARPRPAGAGSVGPGRMTSRSSVRREGPAGEDPERNGCGLRVQPGPRRRVLCLQFSFSLRTESHRMQPGEILWTPGPERVRQANITAFTEWLARERGRRFADYNALWRWSVQDLEGFWQALWDYFGIQSSAPHTRILGRRGMPGAEWFPGARLNYAQHVLRREAGGGEALLYVSETRPLTALDWETLGNSVRTLATQLRALGVGPGDRVVAWMPNIPETMIAMLATTAIGAIWACCSPDFGERGTLDRLVQLSPKVLFAIDGYRYGGKSFDRRSELRHIAASLTSLEHIVYLPYLNPDDSAPPLPAAVHWRTLLERPAVSAAQFQYAQVPFDHPLWTLFSSGTTGLPKPIVHGHGGILLEILKNGTFHFDLHPGERVFYFTTSGWMLWNFLTGTPLTGAVPVLYDGHPAYPTPDVLWQMAEEAG